MKSKFLYGLVASFLLACMTALQVYSEAPKDPAKTKHLVTQSHAPDLFALEYSQPVEVAAISTQFSPAEHSRTVFIDGFSSYGMPAYNRKAPRDGSYYYLMGQYWRCFQVYLA